MWTRAELKSRAKAALKPYYWWGVLICFLAGLFGAGQSSGFSLGGFSGSGIGNAGSSGSSTGSGSSSGGYIGPEIFAIIAAVIGIVLLISLLAIAFVIFVSNVIYIGKINYFLESRYKGADAGVGCLFFGFSKGKYINIVKTLFLKGLFESLWSLLLIVPGIIKHYEYYMVPYLLAEEPAMDRKEAFRISKEMMDGNKFATWVLEMSFIGWYLLGILACCIGSIFINPYYEATFVELYLKLKENMFGAPKPENVYVEY